MLRGPRAYRQKPKMSFGFGKARTGGQTTYAVSTVSELRFGFVPYKCAPGESVELLPGS
ncbi:hypothetical protein SBA4_4570014 [Candidatus Sulfopaludibacter sp. SbA4]|nr:hypothetical protein SBA4_4570014 [Candidatus Sulfopaludibacter sp. SbA4]